MQFLLFLGARLRGLALKYILRKGSADMAKRRCIGIDVFESEGFFNVSDRSKVLYVYLILKSDDEGVVINPASAMVLCSAGEEQLEELIGNGLVLEVEGMYVIRHWYVHNRIPDSKMTRSVYQDVLALLRLDSHCTYEYLFSDC